MDLAIEGKDPNFIFFGGSFLHLCSLLSFVEEQKQKGIQMSGVICDINDSADVKQFNAGHIERLGSGLFKYISVSDKDIDLGQNMAGSLGNMLSLLKRTRFNASAEHLVLSQEKPLYFFYPAPSEPNEEIWNTVLSLSNKVEFLHYDEGVGSYLLNKEDWFELGLSRVEGFKNKAILRIMHSLARPIKIIQEKSLSRLVKYQRYGMFLENDDKFVVSQRNALLYKNAFEQLGKIQNNANCDYGQSVIIAGTHMFERNNAVDSEVGFYKQLIDLIQRYNIEVIIRPHPCETNIEKYKGLGVIIDSHSDIPLESLIATLSKKPLAIIGTTSSAQLIANALWNVNCISTVELFRQRLLDDGAINTELNFRLNELNQASIRFSNFIDSPKTFNELESTLENIFVNLN